MPMKSPRGFLWARGLEKRYERTSGAPAVNGVDLDVQEGAFVTLLGPSGCGKSTTLRMLIGLERPTNGVVGLGDSVLSRSDQRIWVPPNKRNFGMVFQSYAIWPHMTVRNNVAFPLRIRRLSKSAIDEAVTSALTRVGLVELADRSARRLSGGQQQRVAIARALVQSPKVLLLDEPLSNLDATLRRQMRSELKELQREIGVTTVYVTHDQTEAFAMSDEIVVMRAGQVEQVGAPSVLHDSPGTRFVAEFLGGRNILPVTVRSTGQPQTVAVGTGSGQELFHIRGAGQPGQRGFLVCHTKRVRLTDQQRENCLPVTVTGVVYEGDHWDATCFWEGTRINAVQVERPAVKPGQTHFLHFPVESTTFVTDSQFESRSPSKVTPELQPGGV